MFSFSLIPASAAALLNYIHTSLLVFGYKPEVDMPNSNEPKLCFGEGEFFDRDTYLGYSPSFCRIYTKDCRISGYLRGDGVVFFLEGEPLFFIDKEPYDSNRAEILTTIVDCLIEKGIM